MPVNLEMHGDVAVLNMDDSKRNAINHEMLNALHAALDEAEKKAKCVVIKGREGTLSAGFDLKFFAVCTEEEKDGLLKAGSELTARLLRYPMPVVAACTGHGIAMGGFMLLSCDYRYGVKGEFKIGAPETQIEMFLPVFGIELTKERVPNKYWSKVLSEGILLSPEEAVECGFLDGAFEPDQFEESVMAHAHALAKLNSKVFAYNRTALRKATIDLIEASHENGLMPVVD